MAQIVIDPGHGGIDPGGGSNSHFKEKDMVLKISLEQKRHFERHGISVAMTRTTDEYLTSGPRTARVRASGARYCISNHINAFNGKAKGAETIHSIKADKKIAEGILIALVAAGASRRRVFSKAHNGNDYYYMHRLTGSVNTVIVEYGFADNQEDTKKLRDNWRKYAEVVAQYYIENVFQKKYIGEDGGEVKHAAKPAPSVLATKPAPKPSVPSSDSIVDYLNAQGRDSSLSARKQLADQYGIKGYKGTADQNLQLLDKLKKGAPKPAPRATTYKGGSIVDYLNKKGRDSSFSARKRLAAQYGIRNYTGTAAQNSQLLDKLQAGSAPKSKWINTGSIVDYLKATDQPSSFAHRKKLAEKHGIRNYKGTAAQNKKLLDILNR